MHYTPAQTRWFLEAVDRAERQAHQAQAIGARLAQAGDAKAFKKYLDSLEPKR